MSRFIPLFGLAAVLLLPACAAPGHSVVGAPIPPLRIQVDAHVVYDGTFDKSYIDPIGMYDICALKASQYGSVKPKDVCDRPYEIEWYVVLDDPAGKCDERCTVELTLKGKPTKNKNLFAPASLVVGGNVRNPAQGAKYGWGNKRFSYALQLKLESDLIGKKLDPDIMPHPPGG